MIRQELRDKADQLARDLSKSRTVETDWMRELLRINYEVAKEKLVDAMREDVPILQGKARAYEEFFKQLTRPVPDENKE